MRIIATGAVIIIGAMLYWVVISIVDRTELATLAKQSIPAAIAISVLPADGPIEQPKWGSILGDNADLSRTPHCGFFRNGVFMLTTVPNTVVGETGTYTVSCSVDGSLSDTERAPLDLRRGS